MTAIDRIVISFLALVFIFQTIHIERAIEELKELIEAGTRPESKDLSR